MSAFWQYQPDWYWPQQGCVAGQTSKAESPLWLLSPMCSFDPELGVRHIYQRVPSTAPEPKP